MKNSTYQRLVDDHALDSIPKLGEEFFLVLYDDAICELDNFADGAYAFSDREHAIKCAEALANGNMPRVVLRCMVEKRVKAAWNPK